MKAFTAAALAGYAMLITSLAVSAQEYPTERRQTPTGWNVSLGGGLLFNPTYAGDDDYQLSLLPNIRVTYADKFFASVQEGVGYNAVNQNGWRVGPLVKFDFGRDEDGNSPFRIAGAETSDLIGFGQIDFTFEAGGFIEYSTGAYRAKAEMRHGINGHEGFVSEINIDHIGRVEIFGKTVLYSFGPKLKFANARYNQAFFGVSAQQSLNANLPSYRADGGLVSYGISGSQVILISRSVSAVAFMGYDRLAGVAADSTLIQTRGSANQFGAGLFLSYMF